MINETHGWKVSKKWNVGKHIESIWVCKILSNIKYYSSLTFDGLIWRKKSKLMSARSTLIIWTSTLI